MVALENTSTFPIIPKILCFACDLGKSCECQCHSPWAVIHSPWWSLAPLLLRASWFWILITNRWIFPAFWFFSTCPSAGQVSKATWQGFWPFHEGFWSELLGKMAPYLLPGAAHGEISLWTPSRGSVSPGTKCCPLHVPGNSVRAAAEADRLCFALAQMDSLRSHACKALPNEEKRSQRVIF